MEAIVTGRIFSKNILVGYKIWVVKNNELVPYNVFLNDLNTFIKKYNILNCDYLGNNRFKSKIRIPINYFPRFNIKGRKISIRSYDESRIIAISKSLNADDVRFYVCGALTIKSKISGGIIDVYSKRALIHAELYYEEIRNMTTDVYRIAKRTKYSVKDINTIKNYLFLEQHNLDGKYKRFDPSFEIAESWQRLMDDNIEIQEHDLILLSHELYEISLIESGLSQETAHYMATEQYDYRKGCIEYYDKIKRHKKRG